MKTLSIIRHAKSSWDHPHLDDFDRPLNQRGLQNAPMMGQWMNQQGIYPDLIVSSPAQRALMTAQQIANALHRDSSTIHTHPRIYEASLDDLLKTIKETDNEGDHLMLVGHNPGLTLLANRLGSRSIENLPTCALCLIQLPISQWADLDEGSGKTIAFKRPRDIVLQSQQST